MNEQTVAIGALGRVINLSDRRIQQLVKEGVLERHEKGRYLFLSNVKAYVVYLQARADGGGTVIDLEDARKRKFSAEARLAENCNQAMSKLAVAVEAITKAIEENGKAVAEMVNLLRAKVIQ